MCALFIAFGAGVFFPKLAEEVSAQRCANVLPLLNPVNRCSENPKGEWSYETLRQKLVSIADAHKKEGDIEHMSVYFRQLDNGPRFGVGEYDNFAPASLLKVPVMMAVLHAADKDPKILNQRLSYSGSFMDIRNLESPDETISPNTFYTVSELLRRMIVFSDNISKDLLMQRLRVMPGQTVENTYMDLGIFSVMTGHSDTISIQSYAYLFAVLYNSGYLSKEMSQLALDLLSKSTYTDGLVAGVPAGIKVAHKFGVREVSRGNDELHDCGIVYHPSSPYVLCVMTLGSSTEKNAHAIAEISRTVFDGVSALNP